MSDWISVKNRLPELNKPYLVYDVYGTVHESCFEVENGWFDAWADKGIAVSHWMPLPEPPCTD